jgi:nickel/cobalt transporter (NicO) family protein
MTLVSVLLLGMGLGVRHAADADHLVVVSTLVQREPSVLRACRVAAMWGAGHTSAFLALGLLIVHAGLRVSPAFEQAAEGLVGVMLIALGLWHLVGRRHRGARPEPARAAPMLRAAAVGLVHGLAGSAGVALLATASIASAQLATLYLLVFGLGTVFGMIALTVVLSRALMWTSRQSAQLGLWLTRAGAAIGIAMGLAMLSALR